MTTWSLVPPFVVDNHVAAFQCTGCRRRAVRYIHHLVSDDGREFRGGVTCAAELLNEPLARSIKREKEFIHRTERKLGDGCHCKICAEKARFILAWVIAAGGILRMRKTQRWAQEARQLQEAAAEKARIAEEQARLAREEAQRQWEADRPRREAEARRQAEIDRIAREEADRQWDLDRPRREAEERRQAKLMWCHPDGWRRSEKGNYWRDHSGDTKVRVIISSRGDGCHLWLKPVDDTLPDWEVPATYVTAQDAINVSWRALPHMYSVMKQKGQI